MKLLLNTATRQKGIVLFSEDAILASSTWDTQGAELSQILPTLHTLLQSLKADMSQITTCIVVIGPGSFTSVRIAVNIVNTLKFIYPSLSLATLTTGELFSALDDAKHAHYLFQGFASDVFLFDRKGEFVAREDSFAAEKYPDSAGECLEENGSTLLLPPMSTWDFSSVIRMEKKAPRAEFTTLEPFYGKGANITVKKKEH